VRVHRVGSLPLRSTKMLASGYRQSTPVFQYKTRNIPRRWMRRPPDTAQPPVGRTFSKGVQHFYLSGTNFRSPVLTREMGLGQGNRENPLPETLKPLGWNMPSMSCGGRPNHLLIRNRTAENIIICNGYFMPAWKV